MTSGKKNLNGHVVFNKGVFFVQNFTTSGKSLVLTGAWSHPPSWCWGLQHIWREAEPGAELAAHLERTEPHTALGQSGAAAVAGRDGQPCTGGIPLGLCLQPQPWAGVTAPVPSAPQNTAESLGPAQGLV